MIGWERWLAIATHIGFYGVMIALPLTGWAMRSASPLQHVLPIRMFGLPWPVIGPLAGLPADQMKGAEKLFEAFHGCSGN